MTTEPVAIEAHEVAAVLTTAARRAALRTAIQDSMAHGPASPATQRLARMNPLAHLLAFMHALDRAEQEIDRLTAAATEAAGC